MVSDYRKFQMNIRAKVSEKKKVLVSVFFTTKKIKNFAFINVIIFVEQFGYDSVIVLTACKKSYRLSDEINIKLLFL